MRPQITNKILCFDTQLEDQLGSEINDNLQDELDIVIINIDGSFGDDVWYSLIDQLWSQLK